MRISGQQADKTGRSSERVLHRLLKQGLGICFVLLMVQGITCARDPSDSVLILLAAAGYIVLCIPVFFRKNYQVFEPYTFTMAIFLMGYSVKFVYIISADDRSFIDEIMLGKDHTFLIKPGIILLVAFIFLVIGYLVRMKPRTARGKSLLNAQGWKSKRLFTAAILLFGCSVVFFFIYAQQVGIEFTSLKNLSSKRFVEIEGAAMGRDTKFYFKWAANLSRPAFYLLLAWWLTAPRKTSRTVLISLLVATGLMALILPFISSSRTPMVFFILDIIIISYFLRLDRRIWQFLTRVAMVAAVGLFLFVLIYALRANKGDGPFHMELSINDVLSHVVGARYLADTVKTAHIMEAVPNDIPRMYGKTYLTFIYAPIPRSLWPAKPSIGMGPLIGDRVYNRKRTGVPPGFAAEAFINFSVIGIWIGFLLFGLAIKTIYVFLAPYLHTRNGILLYIAFLRIPVVVIGMDVTVGIVQVLLEVLPMIVLLNYISLHPGQGSVATGIAPNRSPGKSTRAGSMQPSIVSS
jgi:oligosaccharide repeat unit polymerase